MRTLVFFDTTSQVHFWNQIWRCVPGLCFWLSNFERETLWKFLWKRPYDAWRLTYDRGWPKKYHLTLLECQRGSIPQGGQLGNWKFAESSLMLQYCFQGGYADGCQGKKFIVSMFEVLVELSLTSQNAGVFNCRWHHKFKRYWRWTVEYSTSRTCWPVNLDANVDPRSSPGVLKLRMKDMKVSVVWFIRSTWIHLVGTLLCVCSFLVPHISNSQKASYSIKFGILTDRISKATSSFKPSVAKGRSQVECSKFPPTFGASPKRWGQQPQQGCPGRSACSSPGSKPFSLYGGSVFVHGIQSEMKYVFHETRKTPSSQDFKVAKRKQLQCGISFKEALLTFCL